MTFARPFSYRTEKSQTRQTTLFQFLVLLSCEIEYYKKVMLIRIENYMSKWTWQCQKSIKNKLKSSRNTCIYRQGAILQFFIVTLVTWKNCVGLQIFLLLCFDTFWYYHPYLLLQFSIFINYASIFITSSSTVLLIHGACEIYVKIRCHRVLPFTLPDKLSIDRTEAFQYTKSAYD